LSLGLPKNSSLKQAAEMRLDLGSQSVTSAQAQLAKA
jgi:hypothetical protein